MTHQTPKPTPLEKSRPEREQPNSGSQRQRPTQTHETGPGQEQREQSNIPDPRDIEIPDPRDIERDPPGEMEFPGPNPDEPAKKLTTSDQDDESPGGKPELSGDQDQSLPKQAPRSGEPELAGERDQSRPKRAPTHE